MKEAAGLATSDEDRVVVCDMGGVEDPDLATVEALARLEMSVRGLGCTFRLRGPPSRLADLLDFCGLDEVLARPGGSALVVEGKPEQGEEPVGIEEEVETGDPPV